MSTAYKHHLTVIAPIGLLAAANNLVACRGIGESGPGDLQSFLPSDWSVGDIPLSFVCTSVTDTVMDGISAALGGEFTCEAPEWDVDGLVDIEAAQDALDNAYIVTDFDPESPCEWDGERLLIVVSGDWRAVMQWAGAEETSSDIVVEA